MMFGDSVATNLEATLVKVTRVHLQSTDFSCEIVAPHYDGNFVRSTSERSMKTFMLYLNGGFGGGSTNFIDEKQQLTKDPVTGIFKADEANILLKVVPEPGMAIVFNHEILHEGEQLKDGVKYIMRTDLMYDRQTAEQQKHPKEEEALLLLQLAETLESDGKAMEAAAAYRKAFRLWAPLADAYKS
jgi:hypothetical protein